MIMQELLAPGTLARGTNDSYSVVNLIGRGGMGAVYRVHRASDQTIWALKEMRPQGELMPDELVESRQLFEREALLLKSLQHPSLPIVLELFEHEGRPTMVMEFVAGQTLEDRMRDANAPLLKGDALGYGIQLCRVLHYLHTQHPPIIYRDLKPSNIMVTPEGQLKLIDFGVARTHKQGKAKDTIAMGSAGYAPPEQYGRGQTDARSDIYALGATLLHLLTNLPPVPLQTPHAGSLSKLNPSVDARTEAVIIRAMDLSREQRFSSCAEMEQALLACLDSPYVPPAPRPVAVASPPPVTPQPPQTAPPTAKKPAKPVRRPAQQAPPPPPPPQEETTPPCHHCGRVNKPQARFCATCGTPLGGPLAARLIVRSPHRTWELNLSKQPVRVGRRDPRQNHYPEVDLAEHDRGIASRHHATIQRDGDFYTVTDLGSTNGTLLNGSLITPRSPRRLRQGDQIKIGEVEIEFRWS
ncbi:MAG: FHA domain-containing protein [Candidatus Viridilinea halotolerans]|uniref:FHA domain-containing protein n=1 Tax=Candidatus Viridilinea halotolerans TaxID=2491704 RepID=A0A426U1A1_9CHLR|nr:MAG: FHA domain-containing protein [Candidatus Viridilinea halotolerans]